MQSELKMNDDAIEDCHDACVFKGKAFKWLSRGEIATLNPLFRKECTGDTV